MLAAERGKANGGRFCIRGTGQLFNPRDDAWREHFRWNGVLVAGLTPVGRATISALRLNRPLIVAIRSEEADLGRHPPPPSIRES